MEMDVEVAFIEQITDIGQDIWEKATHIIASRTFPVVPLDQFAKLCKRDGIKMILDQDDWWHLPSDHPLRETYEERQLRQRIEVSIAIADEVWVTNKTLAKKVSQINRKIRIIPNAINPKEEQWQITREPSDKIRFGYIGGQHHQKDLIESKINLKGYEGFAADIDGYPKLINAKPMKTLPPSEYGKLYQQFDVSLAPLNPSEFAKCKSHLKMIEAGMSGCALIVSDVAPYSPYITKENCLAIPKGGDWMKAIKRLNDNPNQVQDLKDGLREWVKDFSMEKINEMRWNALTNS